jgi:geranylgeranyl reductase family protein
VRTGSTLRADVVVVGAGPIGAVAARSAAAEGASVVLVDRRDDLDHSSACTGLISPRTLSILGALPDCVVREIRAIAVHAPDHRTLDLAADHTKAVVVDRPCLERDLHRAAQEAGVDIRLATEAVSASADGVVLASHDGQQTVVAPIVIGADGPGSRVAQWFGLPAPERFVRAAQVVLEFPVAPRPDRVEVFLGHAVAPGFFAWMVPADDQTARLGLGVSPEHDPMLYLDRLLDAQFPECRVVSRSGGRIPTSPARHAAADGVLLVGDAAGQVKPLSGGGLFPGGVCARIAGRIAAEAARARRPDRMASAYESEWRSAVGREIAFGRSIRRISSMVSDRELSAVFAACDDQDLLAFLAEHADIDRFHRLPDNLAVHPSLWGKILRLLPLVASREIADLPSRSSVVSTPHTSL